MINAINHIIEQSQAFELSGFCSFLGIFLWVGGSIFFEILFDLS